MNRPQDNATTFQTGGDVSRFQRKAMPRGGATSANDFGKAMGNALGSMVKAIAGPGAAGGLGGSPFAVGPTVRVSSSSRGWFCLWCSG